MYIQKHWLLYNKGKFDLTRYYFKVIVKKKKKFPSYTVSICLSLECCLEKIWHDLYRFHHKNLQFEQGCVNILYPLYRFMLIMVTCQTAPLFQPCVFFYIAMLVLYLKVRSMPLYRFSCSPVNSSMVVLVFSCSGHKYSTSEKYLCLNFYCNHKNRPILCASNLYIFSSQKENLINIYHV